MKKIQIGIAACTFFLMQGGCTCEDPYDLRVINKSSQTVRFEFDPRIIVTIAPGSEHLVENIVNSQKNGNYFRVLDTDGELLTEFKFEGKEVTDSLVDGRLYVLTITDEDLVPDEEEPTEEASPEEDDSVDATADEIGPDGGIE